MAKNTERVRIVKMVKCILNGQYEITIPDHRAERPDWYTKEGWERARLDSIHAHTKKGDVMYYVGAEEGEMPALCQMWGAKIVLIEPNPKVWANIKATWKANKLSDPLSFEGFASNEDTRRLFKTDLIKGFPGSSDDDVIGNHGFKELYLEAKNYPQVRVDDITKEHEPPTQISIDVEGSEMEVLRGAEKTIDEHKPKIWLSLHPEFLFHQWGLYGRDVRNWIIDKGYSETLLDYKHEVHLFYEAI
jgi:FkbM family methyltransferase